MTFGSVKETDENYKAMFQPKKQPVSLPNPNSNFISPRYRSPLGQRSNNAEKYPVR